MKTDNHSYLSRLDHLRFLAIALVILTHFNGGKGKPESISGLHDLFNLWVSKGATGVSLFLVISGFIFCVISNAGEKQINYKNFISNRLYRIFPLLIVVFFIIITINREQSTPIDILRLLTLQLNTGNPTTGWGNDIFPSGPIWTIAVEFQFYLIFPFIITILHRMGISRIFLMMICIIMVRAMIVFTSDYHTYDNLYHSITGRLDQFLWGIVFGYLYLKTNNKFKLSSSIFIGLTGAFIITLLMIFDNRNTAYKLLSFNIEAMSWGLVLLAYLKAGISINKIIDSTLSYLGGLSYSLYLTHLPVGSILTKKLGEHNFMHHGTITTIGVILPVCIIISVITYNGIEKPFLIMRKKYLTSQTG